MEYCERPLETHQRKCVYGQECRMLFLRRMQSSTANATANVAANVVVNVAETVRRGEGGPAKSFKEEEQRGRHIKGGTTEVVKTRHTKRSQFSCVFLLTLEKAISRRIDLKDLHFSVTWFHFDKVTQQQQLGEGKGLGGFAEPTGIHLTALSIQRVKIAPLARLIKTEDAPECPH